MNVGRHVLPAVWVMAELSGVCEIMSFLLGVKYLVGVNLWSTCASQKVYYQKSLHSVGGIRPRIRNEEMFDWYFSLLNIFLIFKFYFKYQLK